MSRYLGCSLLVALWAIACGGSTDDSNPNPSGGSTSAGSGSGGSAAGQGAGGSNTAGSSTAGNSNTAGTTNGGMAGTAGTSSMGGTGGTSGSGGAGGTNTVDPRCPPKLPTGMCTAAQADALCMYDVGTECLCYAPTPTSFCSVVDPSCPGGAAPPPDGAAGSASKIALTPKRACRCSAGSWQCGQ